MEHQFWLEKWQKKEIGFHRDDFNPNLKENFPRLELSSGSHILVPLCGKSLDLLWLKEQGHKVTGVELSPLAVSSFFHECNLEYSITQPRKMTKYTSKDGQLTIIQADFLQLNQGDLDPIDAIYDRAAMIALPQQMRQDYFNKLKQIMPKKGQSLLITLEYKQEQVDGPPFSVGETEIRAHLSPDFMVELIEDVITTDLPPRFQEAQIDVHEKIYRLYKNR
jgi:thiopurine S-methyltransferase